MPNVYYAPEADEDLFGIADFRHRPQVLGANKIPFRWLKWVLCLPFFNRSILSTALARVWSKTNAPEIT